MAITADICRNFLGTAGLTAQTLYLNLLGTAAMPTITAATVAGSLTDLADGSGYINATLAGTGWTASAAGGTTTVSYGTQIFSFTGSVGNVQGYSITTGTSNTGNLVAVEAFATAQMVSANGDKINIVPTIKIV